jgi:hypothetical protein
MHAQMWRKIPFQSVLKEIIILIGICRNITMDELFLVCLLIIYNVVELKKGQVLFMY